MNGAQQPPQQGGYPPQQGGYPPQQGGYPPQQGGYSPQQGGYPPQQGGYPPQQGGYPAPGAGPVSGAPKVMGILMIIFASLGLLVSLYRVGTVGSSTSGVPDSLAGALKTYGYVIYLLGLGIGLLHLMAGLSAVKYKANAPKLGRFYGIGAIALNVLSLILYYALVAPKMKDLAGSVGEAAGALGGAMLFVGVIIGSIWPILVLILMNTRKAKAACVN